MHKLTELQRQTLEYIRTQVRETGVVPSRAEIAKGLNLKHKSIVDQRLVALERKGWIELRSGSPRYIRILHDHLPLIVAGRVAAGERILAEDRIRARIPQSLADSFRRRPDFFLRVEGDSMDRLGFVTGSIVAVKARANADSGEVVVARFGEEVTLKRFVRLDERRVELRPESSNPVHEPIKVDLKEEALEIAGVAVGALIGDGFNGPEHDVLSA